MSISFGQMDSLVKSEPPSTRYLFLKSLTAAIAAIAAIELLTPQNIAITSLNP
jgi:hypothetical protein